MALLFVPGVGGKILASSMVGALTFVIFGLACLGPADALAGGIFLAAVLLLAVALWLRTRPTLTIVFGILLAVCVLIILVALTGPVAGFGIWLASGVVVTMTLVQLRVNQQRAFLDLLALVAQKHMPLVPAISAFAADQSFGYRRKLDRFATALQAGTPLGDAIARTRGVLPRQAVALARLGERTGGAGLGLAACSPEHGHRVALAKCRSGATFLPGVDALRGDGNRYLHGHQDLSGIRKNLHRLRDRAAVDNRRAVQHAPQRARDADGSLP